MKGQPCGGLDWFRLPAALLVIAVHTGPLLSYSPGANYLITDILARIAVPFFFAVTGFFLVPRLDQDGRTALLPVLKKLLLLYGASTLLYLPIRVYSGYFSQPNLLSRLARDVLFDGTFYHLWYFPAALLGLCIVYLLVRHTGARSAVWVCSLLYLLGLLGDSYYALSPLQGLYDLLFRLFDYTRNGIFFAPLFLLLGGLLARREPHCSTAHYGVGLGLALAALCSEGILVQYFSLARFDALYLSLPLCIYCLVQLLRRAQVPGAPRVRSFCLLLYILHPLCIVLVRGVAGALGLSPLLVENSLVHYLSVTALTCALALPLSLHRPRPAATKTRAWLELDGDALRHNAATLQALLPEGCSLMAVLKANAYGHGDLAVAKICQAAGVAAWAVATAEEGARLRRGGIRGEILVLGRTAPESALLLARHRLTQTVVSEVHADALSRAGRRLKVHLKIDTGMHRLGLPWQDVDTLARIYALPHLQVAGLFTHLSHAEGLSEEAQACTQAQIRRFWDVAGGLQRRGLPTGALHIQSSYGLLNYGPLPCRYARTGIALYGLLSSPYDRTKITARLRPALSLRARVAQVHTLETGDTAGYDGAFTALRPCRVANLTIGYADGYPRSLSCGVGGVLIRGQYAPTAGRICMDQMLVDVTDIPDAAAGDIATLIGRDGAMELPAGLVAEAAGTITNELLSRLGNRLERL